MPAAPSISPPASADRTRGSHPAGPGRVRAPSTPTADRHTTVLMHLAVPATILVQLAFVVPLVVWLVKRNESAFIDDHGREILNVYITAIFVLAAMFFPVIGWAVAFVWWIAIVIASIRGAVASSNAEFFRYPMTIRVLN